MSAFPPKADINRCSATWPFARGPTGVFRSKSARQRELCPGYGSRLAAIYAKILFFSTRPFKDEF